MGKVIQLLGTYAARFLSSVGLYEWITGDDSTTIEQQTIESQYNYPSYLIYIIGGMVLGLVLLLYKVYKK